MREFNVQSSGVNAILIDASVAAHRLVLSGAISRPVSPAFVPRYTPSVEYQPREL